MTSNIQAAWVPLDGYKAHIAQADLDFSTETNWRVSFSNALYDGSVTMKPRYVTIDNLGNPASVTLTMNGVDTVILPFERTEKVLTGNMGFLDFSADFGSCTVLISEKPFTQKATSDNLFGRIYPVVNKIETQSIASGGATNDTFAFQEKNQTIISILDVTGASPVVSLNTTFPNLFEFEELGRMNWAGVARTFVITRMKILTDDVGSYSGNILCDSTAGAWRFHNLFLENAAKNENPVETFKTFSRTTTVAAEAVLTPSHNLKGLKRLMIMIAGNSIAGTFTLQAMGGTTFVERYDANNSMIATGNIANAGTTDNGTYKVTSAIGTVSNSITLSIKGDR